MWKLQNIGGDHSQRTWVSSWAWWCVSVIPAIRRLKQEDDEIEDDLGYTVKPCLKIRWYFEVAKKYLLNIFEVWN